MLRSVPQMKIVVKKISKVRQNTCNWIKKILDEATRIVNVFLISWLFYLFLFMFNKLTCKVRFHIAVWSPSKSIRASSFIENFLKSDKNQSLSSEICSGGSHEIGRSLPIVFQRNWPRKFPRNSREIWHFFPRPTRSPVFTPDKPWISPEDRHWDKRRCLHGLKQAQKVQMRHFYFTLKNHWPTRPLLSFVWRNSSVWESEIRPFTQTGVLLIIWVDLNCH